MTTRTIRQLRRRSDLQPSRRTATPELGYLYRLWSRLCSRYVAWVRNRRQRTCPVHQSWVECFDTFHGDVTPRPEGHCLKPIDPALPIGPDNFHWVPRITAGRPLEPTLITHRGQSLTIRGWAEHLGIPESTLRYRLRVGLPLDEALVSTSLRTAA